MDHKGPASWDHGDIWARVAAYEHVRVCGPATVRVSINVCGPCCHQRLLQCLGSGRQPMAMKVYEDCASTRDILILTAHAGTLDHGVIQARDAD